MTVKRCDTVRMRKALEAVDELKIAGIEFVPVPVIAGDKDRLFLVELSQRRLERLLEATNAK